MTQYDDYGGVYRRTAQDGFYLDIGGTSYFGISGNAANSYYPLITFRLDMIDAAVMGGADGFVYRDGIPSMIEAACTGNVSENNSLYSLQTRSRNMFSNMLYGGAYSNGYFPIGGYTDTNVKRELLRFCSNETMGYLNQIRESVNISRYDTQKTQSAAAANGWMRSAQNPTAPKTFSAVQLETQFSEGIPTFGGQSWGEDSSGANNCNCPPPDPCIGVDCSAQLCTSCVDGQCVDNPNDNCDPNIPACCQSSEFCTSTWNGSLCITIDTTPDDPLPCPNPCGSGSGSNITSFNNPSISSPFISSLYPDIIETNSEIPSVNLTLQNYQRADNTNRFILSRYSRDSAHTDWYLYYLQSISSTLEKIKKQSETTTRNPIVAVPAIQTHYKKDESQYYPNQYFTP